MLLSCSGLDISRVTCRSNCNGIPCFVGRFRDVAQRAPGRCHVSLLRNSRGQVGDDAFSTQWRLRRVTREKGGAKKGKERGRIMMPSVKHLRPRTHRLRRTILNTLVLRGSTCSVIDRVLGPRDFCRGTRRGVCTTVMSLTVDRHPISVLAIARRLGGQNRLRRMNNPFCVSRLADGITDDTRVRCRTHVVTRGCLTHRLVSFATVVRNGTFSRSVSIRSLVRRTRKGLFRVSRHGIGGSIARVGPIVGRTVIVLRGTTGRGRKLDNLHANFRKLSGVASK